ncbi:hypothetical protein NOS3756_27380 [Nostoc sp. NIES-3756]|uniref:hypothetical protein n=1 Tax=Nostoc sp. NIES-3756 TaxID=1751286 RepID=UPI000722B95F|nr:hypothetical protein [Nostoc sp. NIES-3756]BAT53775.1 hypothetical protein NOS3756_27380 [Nostoc sp. NIES-3756]
MELTLQQLFGVNCSQDGQVIVIQKSDLPLLTPSANNTAESLLVAILLKAFENFQGQLTDPQGNKITDPNGNTINYNNSTLYLTLLMEPWKGYIERRLGEYVVRDSLIIHQYLEYADTEFS